MKPVENPEKARSAHTPVTRRQALFMFSAAAVAVAAAPLLFGGRPAISRNQKEGKSGADLPQDTLLHGAGWCIPH
jgi:hypothetical protein